MGGGQRTSESSAFRAVIKRPRCGFVVVGAAMNVDEDSLGK